MNDNPFSKIEQRFDRLEGLIQSLQKPEPTKEPERFDLTGLQSFLIDKGYPVRKSGIYKATMNHELKFSKFGRSLIFEKSDVLTWIESRTIKKSSSEEVMSKHLAKEANKKRG
jgi:hypothetical protein